MDVENLAAKKFLTRESYHAILHILELTRKGDDKMTNVNKETVIEVTRGTKARPAGLWKVSGIASRSRNFILDSTAEKLIESGKARIVSVEWTEELEDVDLFELHEKGLQAPTGEPIVEEVVATMDTIENGARKEFEVAAKEGRKWEVLYYTLTLEAARKAVEELEGPTRIRETVGVYGDGDLLRREIVRVIRREAA
jgi:hypothetical protein